MELISRQIKANRAARHWKANYYRDGKWGEIHGGSSKKLFEELVSLGPTPSPSLVNEVIGNSTWTDVRCDECKKYVESAVIVGEEPDYESSTACVCVECLRTAVGLLELS